MRTEFQIAEDGYKTGNGGERPCMVFRPASLLSEVVLDCVKLGL